MNLDNLSKHQVILAALLVSFVASIATGIVTVSLMNQAPPPVTQTIDRVIQTTVEQAAPIQNGAAIARETIIVKESDATIAAITDASQSIVRVYSSDPSGTQSFAGLGVIATTTTSSNVYVVGKIFTTDQTSFQGKLEGGNTVTLNHIYTDPNSGLSIFSAEQSPSLTESRAYSGATFADSNGVQLGQSVIAIGGQTSPFISTGIISSLDSNNPSATSSPVITNIRSNISDENLLSDAILVDLSGDIVGFKTGAAVGDGFIPSDVAVSLLNQQK